MIAIGLMSGTSCDGLDCALIDIQGFGMETKVKLLDFRIYPYSDELRRDLLQICDGESRNAAHLSRMNFLLGMIFADACKQIMKANRLEKVDFVGSHGQTIFHEPDGTMFLGRKVCSTFQIGEPSLINEALRCPVVSDFRVRDVAAGGQGAPLVPYTEYLLYHSDKESLALLNLGGIGNITYMAKGCRLDEVFAFDTGPANMLLDSLAATRGLAYDDGGRIALSGKSDEKLLQRLRSLDSNYYKKPPKSTGRELYSYDFLSRALEGSLLSFEDKMASLAQYTCDCVFKALEDSKPDRLLVSGGGAHNLYILKALEKGLPGCTIEANELADSKEAVAFAVLANERLHNKPNTALGATGAMHQVVMGKVSV
ncbi:MAG: anhydro-N-acetylmuramic acid kinase [Sphaerochaetaceae bacterium]|jgi:anhydro-N-acetylmuramic acid kinase|nr:anhydro-N-acetylmuramic acid kinase [Sphaerochaetaceae bacterium]